MEKEELEKEVITLLVKRFDWNLNTSLTTTGRKLVSDTIESLKIIQKSQKIYTNIYKNDCEHEWILTWLEGTWTSKYYLCTKCRGSILIK